MTVGAASGCVGSVRASWLRELMPRAGLMNSCAAICALEAPPLARRAISASCAVRMSGVSAVRLSARAGRAQFDPRPLGERCHAEAGEQLVGAAQLVPGVTDTPLAAQPLAIQQMGAAKFHVQWGAAEVVDGLAVAGLGIVAFADQRTRASLDATCPVGAACAGGLREPLQGVGRAFGHPAAHRSLDEFDRCPLDNDVESGDGVLAALLRCGQCFLILAQAVAQYRGGPPNEGKPRAFTSALWVRGSGRDKLGGLGFPAPEDGQRQDRPPSRSR